MSEKEQEVNREEQEQPESIDFWDTIKGRFARLYTLNSAGPIRCRVIDIVEDPLGKKMLHIILPGKIKFFIYFDQITAYEMFDNLKQLQDLVKREEESDFNSLGPNRRGHDEMLYTGGGSILQP